MTLLYLDFDSAIPGAFWFRLLHCARLWRWNIAGVRYDRTVHGWHVVIGITRKGITVKRNWRRLSPAVVVAAQAILGSDPKREAFNLMRVQQLSRQPKFWRERFNVLYESHRHGVTLGT